MVADLQRRHARADLAHDAGALMAEDRRELAFGIQPRQRIGVGVADAGRHHLDQHLARLRAIQSIVSMVSGLPASQATAALVSMAFPLRRFAQAFE